MNPLFWVYLVGHSMSGKWPLLQSQTTQSMPVSRFFWEPCFRSRFKKAIGSLCRRKLNRAEPQEFRRTDQNSLSLGVMSA